MSSNINLNDYKLQKITDEAGSYLVNIGSLSPLAARDNQMKMSSKDGRKVVYTAPTGEKFSVLISQRAFQLLSELRDGRWHTIKSFKTEAETRKPISELRQLGLIIATKYSPNEYRLFGHIELYPLGLGIGVKSVTEVLPKLKECHEIEEARENARHSKRKTNIQKTAKLLEDA